MRFSPLLFLLASLLVSGGRNISSWAADAPLRPNANVILVGTPRASGPDVAGYTLVTSIDLGTNNSLPEPGATVELTATLGGSGNAKVMISFNSTAGGMLPTCEAIPGDSCTVDYKVPDKEGTIYVTASAKGTNPGAKTITSNKVPLKVKRLECDPVTMIPGFDLGSEIGKFETNGFRMKVSAVPEITTKTGTWNYLKCQCPDNPTEKNLKAATVSGAGLGAEAVVQNPWGAHTDFSYSALGAEFSANAYIGVVPTLSASLDNIGGTFKINECRAYRREVELAGSINASINVKVGGKAQFDFEKYLSVTQDRGALGLTYINLNAEFAAVEANSTATGTMKYSNGSFAGSNFCVNPLDVTLAGATLELRVPSIGVDLDLADLGNGLFKGKTYSVLKGDCWEANY